MDITTESRPPVGGVSLGLGESTAAAPDRPRILYLSANDPRTALTGAAQRVAAFTRFLSERFPVHLRYLEGAGQPPVRVAPPARTLFPKLATEQAFEFSAQRYFLFSADVLRSAEAVLRDGEADVIVCDYGVWALYGLLLARRYNVPFIYSSHNVEWRACFDKAKNDLRRLPLSGYYYGIERLGVRRADLLIAITDADAARFSRWRGDKPTLVVPQGIDEREFSPPAQETPGSPRRVLFCGNFGIPFNQEAIAVVARDVVPAVLAKRPDTLFEFIGAHPPARSPHPAMIFTGYVDDYAERLRTADAVMVPILRGHGFPTKIVEALACGRPTVATPVGARGLTFHVPHLRVEPIENFAAALLDVLDHPERVDRTGTGRVLRRYGWNAILSPLEDAILSLAASRRGRP